MRLLYIHERFGSLGGAEANVFATAWALKKKGHAVGLVTRKKTGREEPEWAALFEGGVFFPSSISVWRELLEKFRPDAVYVHKWEEIDSIKFLLGADVPLVRMVHDHDLYCLRSYKYNPLTRRICTRPATGYCVFPCLAPLKRNREGGLPFKLVSYRAKVREIELNRRFDHHLVASEYMRHELLINGFGNERIETLPPVPPPVEPLRSSFGPRNLLVYAGQIIRGKGVDVLLRALQKAREPFEAVIAGDGTHRAHCERLSRKLGLEGRVKFLGFVTQKELASYYKEATAVLVSSVWPEPFGLVGLEAMRCGLPVVAFGVGGIGDWLQDGENGFLIPWMDAGSYAAAIDRLLRDKALARAMGEKGLERVSRDYDFDRYISNLENLFERVVREKRPS